MRYVPVGTDRTDGPLPLTLDSWKDGWMDAPERRGAGADNLSNEPAAPRLTSAASPNPPPAPPPLPIAIYSFPRKRPTPTSQVRLSASATHARTQWTTSSTAWPKRPPNSPPGTSFPPSSSPVSIPNRACATSANAPSPTSAALLTPLNLILLSLLLYTLYSTFFSSSSSSSSSSYPTLPRGPPPTVFRTYTPRSLLPYNGTSAPGAPVYFAVRGRVFDVSRGRNFYGPGGPYANFAGRDASRGLACGSFDEDMLTEDLDGPLDTLADLGPDEMEALRGWEERFLEKYDVVGRLVSVGEYNERKQQQSLSSE